MAVGIARYHPHLFTHLGFRQRQAGCRRAAHGVPRCTVRRHLPLIADGPQAIRVRQCIVSRQHLVLHRGTAHRHVTGRGIIDVCDCGRCGARPRLHRTVSVGIARHHSHLFAHQRFCQCKAGRRRATNVVPRRAIRRGLPLVDHTAQSVRIRQRLDHRQGLPLRQPTCYRQVACRRGIEYPRQVCGLPDEAIRKFNPLNGKRTGASLGKANAVYRRSGEENITAISTGREICRRDAGTKHDSVASRCFGNRIPAAAKVIPVGIIASPAYQGVTSTAPAQRVVAGTSLDDVVAGQRVDDVVGVVTDQNIIACGRPRQPCLHISKCPTSAIIEFDRLDAGCPHVVIDEIAFYQDIGR